MVRRALAAASQVFAIALGITVPLTTGCRERCPSNAPVSPATTPLGRVRAGTFDCPIGGSQKSYAISESWPRVDPKPDTVLDDNRISPPPYDFLPDPNREVLGAPTPATAGIWLCGALAGAAGSVVHACVADGGEVNGPVEMIAPDGSILVQGYCDHGARLGPWVAWRNGDIIFMEDRDKFGAVRGLRIGDPAASTVDEYEGRPVTAR